MVGLGDLFAKLHPGATAGEIIRWWEARRLHYNVIIFAWALIVLAIGYFWTGRRDKETWTRQSLYAYLLLIQLPANIWYTGGWIVDLIVKKFFKWPSPSFEPWALGLGIALSLLFYFAIMLKAVMDSPDR
jgi:hypothetical protein